MINQNFIIHQKAFQYQWSGESFLSVKSFYGSGAHYLINQRQYWVDDKNYLILNDTTKYQITIDSPESTESFCVFFSPAYVIQFLSEREASVEKLLDFNLAQKEGLKLFERNFAHRGLISNYLHFGRKIQIANQEKIRQEEFYLHLLNAVFDENQIIKNEVQLLQAKRKSTREEIYRRIYYAKDYIDAFYDKGLTLKEIARIALLSENHLLRCFKEIFQISPFQYITRLKIKQAQKQLRETNKSISSISCDLGYTSLSNFSDYFKKLVGLSPSAYRKKVIYRK